MEVTTVVPHRHVELPSTQCIRVIHLQPSVEYSSRICCSLAVVDFAKYADAEEGEYTALSYSWDAQSPCKEVTCDGGTLLVTPNCDAALRRLRSPNSVEILWIDSICINQGSDAKAIEERNHQVALMGEIYKKAKRVVVWVGEKDAEMELAIKTIRDIGETPQDRESKDRRAIQHEIHARVQAIASRVKRPSDDPITPLFERSWFHRMWTIQEVTMCMPNRIVLWCGDVELPWLNLIIATDALGKQKYSYGRWDEAMSLQKALTMFLIVHRWPAAKKILDDNPGDIHNEPLAFNILVQAREKKSSDPKDKVFALYGICKELEVPLPTPDYKKTVEEIFREATVAAITYDKNIYILYYVPSNNRRAGLASWVPDWSDAGWKQSDSRYALLRDRFAACGPSESNAKFSEDGKRLIVKGKIVDSVIYRTEPLPEAGTIQTQMRNHEINPTEFYQHIFNTCNVLRTWVEVSQWSGEEEYPNGERVVDALQRTLVNDEPQNNADSIAEGAFASWYEFMTIDNSTTSSTDFSAQQGSILGAARAMLSSAVNGLIPEPQKTFLGLKSQGRAFKFHSLVMAFMQNKCFFYTEKSYFGTAPDPLPVSLAAGDCIAVVGGLGMPLLLRPVDGGYQLLSHVYVHGIMHGEVWPDHDHELEDIVLV